MIYCFSAQEQYGETGNSEIDCNHWLVIDKARGLQDPPNSKVFSLSIAH